VRSARAETCGFQDGFGLVTCAAENRGAHKVLWPPRRTGYIAERAMKIRFGYELVYECPQPTPMILTLNLHFSRVSDLLAPDHLIATPSIPIRAYRDAFGNWCSRIVAPPGELHLCTSAVIDDSGEPDVVAVDAQQHAVEDLPDDCIVFLLGSRYCETDRLTTIAWDLFDKAPTGWGRVQAICDFVHDHITFGYEHARPTKTAWEVFHEKAGVCRDFAHLAIAFCRCMNIPARYCTGYLGDIGIAPTDAPMDFHGWLEAYLGGHWYTFDPRNKVPRIGRLLIACGRDAADVAISTTFGPNTLKSFKVWTDPIPDANPTLSTVAIEESISMQKLTSDGQQRISDLAQRYGVSTDAVTTLLQAVVNGNGTMAQFYHQELGGGGQ
ncbi:MAG: transglutaminase family protein, partial [Myxococcales bacterium]